MFFKIFLLIALIAVSFSFATEWKQEDIEKELKLIATKSLDEKEQKVLSVLSRENECMKERIFIKNHETELKTKSNIVLFLSLFFIFSFVFLYLFCDPKGKSSDIYNFFVSLLIPFFLTEFLHYLLVPEAVKNFYPNPACKDFM